MPKPDQEQPAPKDMKTRQREFLEQLFGKPKSTNIWGKKFSIFAFIFLLIISLVAFIGIRTGAIDLQEQMRFRPDSWSKTHPGMQPKQGNQ